MTSAPPLARPRVWIVDDSALDVERARSALRDAYELRAFGDGSTVVEALTEGTPPDALVLDCVMPAVSGLEVVDFIRAASAPISRVQILLLTVRQSPEQIVEGLNAGANDYLAKPYAPEELRARVAALLRSASLLARAQAAESEITELVASSPDPMLAIDRTGCIAFANAEAVRALAGVDPLGRSLADALPQLAEQLEAATMRDVVLGTRVFEPSMRAISGGDGRRTIVTLRDVSDQRRRAQRRLDFYSIIAHDLRSPLQSMTLRTMMLREGGRGPIADSVRAELGKLDASIKSMIALINDFLEMARTEASAHTLHVETVDLAQVIDGVVESLEPLATSKSQHVLWSPEHPPLKMVHGDARGLAQVVTNLLGNALKFSPEGAAVTVTMSARGSVIRTEVADAGPGIAREEQSTLFERFTRGASPSGEAGTGLGLMIVYQLVEAHGGRVGLDSAVGVGSRFWFDLPAVGG